MAYEISRDAALVFLLARGHTEATAETALVIADARQVYSDPALSITARGPDRYVAVDKARL